jgi:subtilisin family serine protease
MLQIVHDVAPKAKLAFYSAFNGEAAFAEGIEALARPTSQKGAGAQVIVDDVGYFEEPFFQDGPVAAAIDKVTEEGVTYLTAAGNDNLFDSAGDEISSWEAPEFRDSGSCPGAVRALSDLNPHHCLDFDPGEPVDRTFGIRVEPEETLSVDLQWAEPWFGVETDLDAFLLDAEGELLTASTEANVTKSQEPVEIVQWTNESTAEKTVQLVVNRYLGSADPRLKFILLENGEGVSATEYPISGGGDVVGPSVYGHAGAADAISVGAVPYNHSNLAEEYTSRGPVTHYFGPVEPETESPAALLPTPQVISEPDVAATDCGRTTFFARQPATEPGVWRFCGTSAAAPHVAGVAALMLQEDGSASSAEVEAALAGTAVGVGGSGPCVVGGGLVEALGAVTAISGGPETPPSTCEYPDAAGPVVRAPGDWGSEEPPAHESQTGPPGPSPTPPAPQPPTTSFLKHPAKTVRTRGRSASVVFRFGSDQAGAGFLCRIDSSSAFKACGPKLARAFGLGKHVVRVKARSSAGLTDSSAAVFGFRVRRVG